MSMEMLEMFLMGMMAGMSLVLVFDFIFGD